LLLPAGDADYLGVAGIHPINLPPPSWYKSPGLSDGRSFAISPTGTQLSISSMDALEHTHILGPTGVGKSMAQEESRKYQRKRALGQHKRMQDGKVSMPYKRFLGYAKGPDGKPQIVESEAGVVRRMRCDFCVPGMPLYGYWRFIL